MIATTHIWIEEPTISDELITLNAVIERPDQQRSTLWYRVPAGYGAALTSGAEPFVLGALFTAMREATDLHVHGAVSPILLRNLEEFQAVWHCWLPTHYTPIAIQADDEREQPEQPQIDAAIAAFSGGVDSSFTMLRHQSLDCGRVKHNLRAGVMVHGFDIPLDEPEMFTRAAAKSARMLNSLGVDLITMATNIRDLGGDWEQTHGAATASCLMLLQGSYRFGLLASTGSYNHPLVRWGSTPITDWMLSSGRFQLIHDGAAFTRSRKIMALSTWPAAMEHLRVCWEGLHKDQNCCRCEKCIRTILNFRALGLALPPCFEHDPTDDEIAQLRLWNPFQSAEFEQLLISAKSVGITDSWVRALEQCLRYAQRRRSRKSPLIWRTIRKTLGLRTRMRRLMARFTPSTGVAPTRLKE